ncbi:uncharacterized protein LOC126905597 [Daktulosphaira vitifoliae]|uniref:uncharacterized protein LOC126905597 n=1 Tax=Daktulosphaira vitifoliae TaxID=58002 RepID=UPI0021AA8346|nr:uncharacterized protein LOC126905597 [Daktulosphaira vitifoliae]
MVYFTEKLIHEIHNRSCIWDTADVNHLNKEVLTNMWMEIAESLYSDWHALSSFDQRDRVADVKKKWTNIKDSFVKDVKGKKPRKSKGPPEHRKKYYLYDHLQFLIPFIQDSKSSKNSNDRENPKKKIKKNLGEGSSKRETTPRYEPVTPADVQLHAETLNAFAGKLATETLCQLDGDLSFMVSLMPTVKSMNEKQKIDFKIGVLQLVARIKYNDTLRDSTYTGQSPFMPDLRCFSVPYQHFPFINPTVSSSQSRRRSRRLSVNGETPSTTPLKNEACSTATSPSTSYNDELFNEGRGEESDN